MIIDGHSHMFTKSMFGKLPPNIPERFKKMQEHTVEDNTKAWISAMDRLGIEKTVFMSTSRLNKDFIEFIGSSDRLVGFAKMNPTASDAIKVLKEEIEAGMKGVKLYASEGEFDVGSKDAYPFYKHCEENQIPITIHFGVTIGFSSDLRTGNPLLISKALKDFPELKFTIAHFGAGFFREVLMLRYKQPNLSVDTSGTNNWLAHQDSNLTLKDVFRKSIEVFTTEGLIYGSDTTIFPDGYRDHILKQQTDILKELDLSKADQEKIMYGNAKRIFGI
jgi:predicted TIM-barrel fold metal-dependent hydrolase